MPTKITSLTSLGATPADNDVVPIVDVSDTSQAATGTAKKLTAVYFAKTDGSATTVTGGGTISLGGYTVTVPSTGTVAMDGHNHDASDIATGTLDDARVAESNVTQHEGALTITESQISDLGTYLESVSVGGLSDTTIDTPADNEVLAYDSTSGNWINQTPAEAGLAEATHNQAASTINSGTFDDARIAESNVTQHEGALTITESQISDLDKEPALGNPVSDGYVLSSTAAGTRSWVANSSGPDEYIIPLHIYTITTTSSAYSGKDGHFRFSSDMVPAGYSVYFGVAGKKSSSATCYIALAESDTTTPVSGTELTFTTTSYVWAETSALTLVDGTIYELIIKIGTSSQTATGISPQLIIRRD